MPAQVVARVVVEITADGKIQVHHPDDKLDALKILAQAVSVIAESMRPKVILPDGVPPGDLRG